MSEERVAGEQPDKTQGDPRAPEHDHEQAPAAPAPDDGAETTHGDPLSPHEGEPEPGTRHGIEPERPADDGPEETVAAARPVLPPDPAGTQPKVEASSLLPARSEPLLGAGEPPREPPSPLPAPVAEAGMPAPAGERVHTVHAPRFQFLLGALIAFGISAVAALLLALGAGGGDDGPGWSAWRPTASGPEGAQQIAAHVGPLYRLATGEQMVLVEGGELEYADLPIEVALRDREGELSLVEGDGLLYRLCGMGPKCSINIGKASPQRHYLLRRQALELALYSFRYLRGVDQVVVLMPPPPGTRNAQGELVQPDAGQALFFRRDDLSPALETPLRSTLTAAPPKLDAIRRAPDTEAVNRITGRGLHAFSLTQANQDENLFLVLQPYAQAVAAARRQQELLRREEQQRERRN